MGTMLCCLDFTEALGISTSQNGIIFVSGQYVSGVISEQRGLDMVSLSDAENYRLTDYRAIALPAEAACSRLAQRAFAEGLTVYLYGSLTIRDYKDFLALEEFAIPAVFTSSDGRSSSLVKQGFDASFEENELFHIIGLGSRGFLCKLGVSSDAADYLPAIKEHADIVNREPDDRRSAIGSGFDFATYWGDSNQFSSHMDYTLFREMDEYDPEYDYFAIRTRAWVEPASGEVTEIKTKHELPYSIDNLLETGPSSQSNIGTLNISVGFGSEGLNGTIGYSLDLSDQRPSINRTEDYTNDVVEWKMTPRFLFPRNIDDAQLVCVSSWASTDQYGGIDISYDGVVNIGTNGQYPTTAGYTTIPVRFDYRN